MLQLRDIMTTDVVTLAPEATLRDAMELFAHHHVSGAPVVAGDRVVGVITATDLMMFATQISGVPTERDDVDDWTDEPPNADDPTIDDEPSPAFFTEFWDDAGADVAARMASPDSPEWDVLDTYVVRDAMTAAPIASLPSTASAETAADLMRRRRIHRVLVTDDHRLVGIVSTLDIANAVADHRFTVRRYVFNNDRL